MIELIAHINNNLDGMNQSKFANLLEDGVNKQNIISFKLGDNLSTHITSINNITYKLQYKNDKFYLIPE